MTDSAIASPRAWGESQAGKRRRKRNAADRRLRWCGIGALFLAVGLLGILLATLVAGGVGAFVQTHVRIDFPISPDHVDPADPAEGNYRNVVRDALFALFPEVTTPRDQRALGQLLTNNARFIV